MILARLEQADRYLSVHPGLSVALAFLRGEQLGEFPPGRVEIQGGVYAMVARAPLRQRSEARLETHRRYIDVQYVIRGVEEIGWSGRAGCRQPVGDYDAEADIEFFGDAPDSCLTLHAGEFAVFFPDDAHAPLIGAGEVHKVVVKLPL